MRVTLLEKVFNDLRNEGLNPDNIRGKFNTLLLTAPSSDNEVYYKLNQLFYTGLVAFVPESCRVRRNMLAISNPVDWYRYFKDRLLVHVATYFFRTLPNYP